MSKIAIIVGSDGQDGKIAYDLLSKIGYRVLGIDKEKIKSNGLEWNSFVDITDRKQIFNLISLTQPDEIYFFAAFHNSSEDNKIDDFTLFQENYKINVFSLINFLEAIKKYSLKTKIFYASSSLIFEDSKIEMLDESVVFNPNSIYGITKLDGLLVCRFYRKNYNIFVSSGILFNHESEYRQEKFLSRKIIQGAIDIKKGQKNKLILGDLNSEIDWGYAYDFVDAMYKILQITKPDDFIIATGEKHSVLDFVKEVFNHLELDWKKYIEEDKSILTRKRRAMIGNYKKLKDATGWEPKFSFKKMIAEIISKLEK